MKRDELETLISETYNADADYPWLKYPNYEVFRHSNNQKWFALIMDVPKDKLGLQGTELLDVVNFKCDPILIGSLRGEPGIFPAYHMNKEQWITVALDGSVSDDKIKMLLDMSYQATAPKARKNKC
ncbi:MAG: MmcQ/YjbR family DNA-binding protein [Clostridia bacterium]|nr:MmcQ/YjbR family DNA-binding protein [Clostridia bacterium]